MKIGFVQLDAISVLGKIIKYDSGKEYFYVNSQGNVHAFDIYGALKHCFMQFQEPAELYRHIKSFISATENAPQEKKDMCRDTIDLCERICAAIEEKTGVSQRAPSGC
ncbi:MAG: hypothetical protein N3D84_02280 [Candidatus Woesearchaeota archaeon]|nr:hypothetical protein [Candidatus Woesearchaeota archaeon]